MPALIVLGLDVDICGAMRRWLFAPAMLLLFASCQPQNVREEKAMRRQLGHEMRHHSYESAIPLARRLIRIAPQDQKLWQSLVQAQIGLHDFDGARVSLGDWRAAVHPVSGHADELEGDILQEEGNTGAALQAWRRSVELQPKNERLLSQKIIGGGRPCIGGETKMGRRGHVLDPCFAGQR